MDESVKLTYGDEKIKAVKSALMQLQVMGLTNPKMKAIHDRIVETTGITVEEEDGKGE